MALGPATHGTITAIVSEAISVHTCTARSRKERGTSRLAKAKENGRTKAKPVILQNDQDQETEVSLLAASLRATTATGAELRQPSPPAVAQT